MPLRLNPVTGELFIQGLDYVDFDRPPTAADNTYEPPFGWLDTSLDEWYVCVALSNTGVATWKAAGGDVTGPASSTDNALARFDGTTGKLLQNSVAILDDAGVLTGVTQLDVDNLRLDGNTISSTDAAGDVIFAPDTTGGAVVTTSLTIGNTSKDVDFTLNGVAISSTATIHAEGATDLGGLVEHRHSPTASFGAHTIFLRSKGTEASPTIVADNDALARLVSAGYDGTDYAQAAEIRTEVDGTPGADDMPGRLVFLTSADGAQTPIEALRIDSSQLITLANALTVPNGGLGRAILTDGAILVGDGTNAVEEIGPLTDGQLLIGSTAGVSPIPATITAGAGVTVLNGAGTITISSSGGFTWNEVTGTSQLMAASNAYIANNAGLVTLTLPSTAAVGDQFQIVGKGAGLFKVAQNAGQTIHFVNTDTTTGTGGSLTAIEQYASIEFVCTTANTDFVAIESSGNYTIV